MRGIKEWNEHYLYNDLPWDTGFPDTYLVRLVSGWPVIAGGVLEVGCGTGTNTIWLAGRGFRVTGLDISSEAVGLAKQRSMEKGVDCRFQVGDFLNCSVDGAPFAFIFDRGCFHSAGSEEGRAKFVEQVAAGLDREGLWFSLMGNRDEIVEEGKGPPRLSALEIAASVEPAFEILLLQSCLLESRKKSQPRFWQCLMRKRGGGATA